MRTYTKETDGFVVTASWIEESNSLRITSGPVEDRTEMIVDWRGVNKWGARAALNTHFEHMIGNTSDINEFLTALDLPSA